MGFLRKLFGPSEREVWQQLSGEIGARVVDGGFWKGAKVQAAIGPWTITLDTYTTTSTSTSATDSSTTTTDTTYYTRLRAPYVNPDGFRFGIYRRNFLVDIAKKFGLQDVEVGFADFDHEFIIKGNSDAKLRALFANAKLRALLLAHPDVHFAVVDSEGVFGPTFPPDTDELVFTAGYTKDIPRLKTFFDLFAVTLDQLCHIGSAYENKPNVEL